MAMVGNRIGQPERDGGLPPSPRIRRILDAPIRASALRTGRVDRSAERAENFRSPPRSRNSWYGGYATAPARRSPRLRRYASNGSIDPTESGFPEAGSLR